MKNLEYEDNERHRIDDSNRMLRASKYVNKLWHERFFSQHNTIHAPNLFYTPLAIVAMHQQQLISRFIGWETVRSLVSFTVH